MAEAETFFYDTVEFLMVQPPADLRRIESLIEIVRDLRGPDGCPWDKEQTHRTLTPYAIEESHELAEAIEAGDEKEMVSELGDLLLQVVLHAEIGRQEKRFDIHDVVAAISEKMVRRHPHVFSDLKVEGSEQVLANWAEIKKAEKSAKKSASAELDRFDVPLALPALSRSHKIGERTKRLRFDWNTPNEVFAKVMEELGELADELHFEEDSESDDRPKDETNDRLESEIGDLLFSTAQLARHLGLDAEQALRRANGRFEKRFFTMRKQISASGRDYDKLTSEQLEEAWQAVKRSLKK